jgi:hypothetical protein
MLAGIIIQTSPLLWAVAAVASRAAWSNKVRSEMTAISALALALLAAVVSGIFLMSHLWTAGGRTYATVVD